MTNILPLVHKKFAMECARHYDQGYSSSCGGIKVRINVPDLAPALRSTGAGKFNISGLKNDTSRFVRLAPRRLSLPGKASCEDQFDRRRQNPRTICVPTMPMQRHRPAAWILRHR